MGSKPGWHHTRVHGTKPINGKLLQPAKVFCILPSEFRQIYSQTYTRLRFFPDSTTGGIRLPQRQRSIAISNTFDGVTHRSN